MTDQKLQPIDNDRNLPTGVGFGPIINPEVVFEKIDKLKDSVTDIVPNILQVIIDPGAREVARQLRGLQADTIKARREMIQGLSDAIEQYVRVHVDQLGQERAAFLLARFAGYRSDLNKVNENAIVDIYETFADLHKRLLGISGLTDEQKKNIGANMYKRAEENATDLAKTFNELLNGYKALVSNTINEISTIGKKPRT